MNSCLFSYKTRAILPFSQESFQITWITWICYIRSQGSFDVSLLVPGFIFFSLDINIQGF